MFEDLLNEHTHLDLLFHNTSNSTCTSRKPHSLH